MEELALTRRKRNTEPLLVLRDDRPDGHKGFLEKLCSTDRIDVTMSRPTSARIESAGRWEVEIDDDSREVRGVRIYIPNATVQSRAFYPLPVHIDTAQGQRMVMRWLNQMMDLHYTLNSLERRYISNGYEDLSRSIRTLLQQLVSAYQEEWLLLNHEKSVLLEESGLRVLNGQAQKIDFTHSIDFVAALSAPEDRYLIRTISALDQLIAFYEKAYLTVDLPQERYVCGTQNAYHRVEKVISESLRQARTQTRGWIAEAESLSVMGSI